MALASSPSPRRERWLWLPILFLKSKIRPAEPPPPERSRVDRDTSDLFRLIASALPRCVASESSTRAELEDISDRLELLAGGLPEQGWADSLAGELASRRRDHPPASPIRVTWAGA